MASRRGKSRPANRRFQEDPASVFGAAVDAKKSQPDDPKQPARERIGSTSEERSPRRSSDRRGRKEVFWRKKIPFLWAVAGAVVVTLAGGSLFYSLGINKGIQEAEAIAVKENVAVPDELQATLDAALADIQSGRGDAAVASLSKLQRENPNISSMPLLIANAALIAGNVELAQEKITESIERRESLSDALILQAMLEAKMALDKNYKKMGAPGLRIEHLLRQAIAADCANDGPYYELATLKRFERKPEEALALLKSAQNRLNPVDSRFTVDLAIELVKLQLLEDKSLPTISDQSPLDSQTLFLSAYIALRQGNSALAAKFFQQARERLPENVFRQIVKDPAFLPYWKDPALASFLEKKAQSY
jgi:tetratricopeptide (TPR) repeat protein